MLSKVMGVYRLTRDVEFKYLQTGTAVATLGLANSEKFKVNGEQRENSCFIDGSIFNKLAEVANQYLRKGSQVYIVADLSFKQWVDQNGQKRSKHKLKIDSFEMLGSKDNSSSSQPQQNQAYQEPQPQQKQAYQEPQPQQKQAYQEPKTQYERQRTDGSYQPTPTPSRIPSIDIDTDEIPF